LLEQLSEFIVRATNLLEAEGRLAKQHARRFCLSILAAAVAAVVFLVALLAFIVGVYLGLVAVGSPVPVALIAIACLAAAVAFVVFHVSDLLAKDEP